MNQPMERRYNRTKVKRKRKDPDEKRPTSSAINQAQALAQGSKEKHHKKSVSQFTKVVREFGERREHFDSKAYAGIVNKVRGPSAITKGRLTSIQPRGLFMRGKVSRTVSRGSPLNELNQARLDDNLFQIIRLANNEARPIATASHSMTENSPLHVYEDDFSPVVDDPPIPAEHRRANLKKRPRNLEPGQSSSSALNTIGNTRFLPKFTSTELKETKRVQPRRAANQRAKENMRRLGNAGRRLQLLSSGDSTSGGAASLQTGGSTDEDSIVEVAEPSMGSYEQFAANIVDSLDDEYLKFRSKSNFLLQAKKKLQGFYKATLRKSKAAHVSNAAKLTSSVGTESTTTGCRAPFLPVPSSSAMQGALAGVSCSTLYHKEPLLSHTAPHQGKRNGPRKVPTRPVAVSSNRPRQSRSNAAHHDHVYAAFPATSRQERVQQACIDHQGNPSLPPANALPQDFVERPTVTTAYQQRCALDAPDHRSVSDHFGDVAFPNSYLQELIDAESGQRMGASHWLAPEQAHRDAGSPGGRPQTRRGGAQQDGRGIATDGDHDDQLWADESYCFSPYVPDEPIFDNPLQFLHETVDRNLWRDDRYSVQPDTVHLDEGGGDTSDGSLSGNDATSSINVYDYMQLNAPTLEAAESRHNLDTGSTYGLSSTLAEVNFSVPPPKRQKQLWRRSSDRPSRLVRANCEASTQDNYGDERNGNYNGGDVGNFGRDRRGNFDESRRRERQSELESQEQRIVEEWCAMRDREQQAYMTEHKFDVLPAVGLQDSGIDMTVPPAIQNPWVNWPEDDSPVRKFYPQRLY